MDGDRLRLPANRNCYRLSRVSWALLKFLVTSAKLCFCRTLFVCLFVCVWARWLEKLWTDLSEILRVCKLWGCIGHGINYQWFNFGRDPEVILDSGSLWNFRYHCVKGGIREPLAKRRWWRHLATSFALAEVPAGYDCFSSQGLFLSHRVEQPRFAEFNVDEMLGRGRRRRLLFNLYVFS